MTTLRGLVSVGLLVLTMAGPAPAWGQAKAPKRDPKKAARPDHAKVLRLEELKVEGRIQKPQAMFLMPRANLNVGNVEASEPFLPKVVEALDRAPF